MYVMNECVGENETYVDIDSAHVLSYSTGFPSLFIPM